MPLSIDYQPITESQEPLWEFAGSLAKLFAKVE